MSAFIKSQPPLVALSQEPMNVTIATNNVTSARAQAVIQLTNSGPLIDQSWTLGWAGKYILFTFKGNPNSSGIQLPVADPSLGVTAKYTQQLAEYLTRHEWIADQFDTTLDLINFKITLRSRFDTPLTIVSIAPVSDFAVTVSNATSPYLHPNLTALLKVVSKKGREYAKLTGNYSIEKGTLTAWEGRSTFDIGSLFDIAPHLPKATTLDPSVPFTKAIAFRAYAKYFLRYADKFGTPPVAEALARTEPTWAIYGGRSVASTHVWQADANKIYHCHPVLRGPVTRHQPSWYYFFPTEGLKNLDGWVYLETADGRSLLVHRIDAHAAKGNRLYYYRTGFDQLNLGDAALRRHVNDQLIGYTFKLIDSTTSSVKVEIRYDLEDARYDSQYLAYSNGLGGIDTLHVKGGFTVKSEGERTIVKHTDPSLNNSPQFGSLATTDATAQGVWEMQTGLLTPQYAAQLQQLLTADVWLIDQENRRFLKLILDSKSLEKTAKSRHMVALNLVFKTAWIDRNSV